MTRSDLEKVRDALMLTDRSTNVHNAAKAIIEAELAKPEGREFINCVKYINTEPETANPEVREWRVLAEDHSQCFASEAEANAAADWLRTNDAGNVYVDSRTVGLWERVA